MKTKSFLFLVGLLGSFLVASVSLAQIVPTVVNDQNRTGDLPFSTSVGTDVEHVDVGSGDLVVHIPILSVKGRGSDYNYALQYHGHVWITNVVSNENGTYQEWEPETAPNVAVIGPVGNSLGWTDNSSGATRGVVAIPCALGNEVYYTSYILVDTNGVKHPLATQFSLTGSCAIRDTGPDLTGQGMNADAFSGADGFANSVRLADGKGAAPRGHAGQSSVDSRAAHGRNEFRPSIARS